MEARRRLFPYLLLNIFVSALVTGTIIFFYNRAHPANCPPATTGLSATADASEADVSISGVVGAGTAGDELVIIQNTGNAKLTLTGWTLENNAGIRYTFPASPELTVYPGATVQVHTKAGQNTPADLYWGRTEPVWKSGQLAVLYDPGHNARGFYRVP